MSLTDIGVMAFIFGLVMLSMTFSTQTEDKTSPRYMDERTWRACAYIGILCGTVGFWEMIVSIAI
jgi:hypothetical protein